MNKLVIGLFTESKDAHAAVTELKKSDLADDITVIAKEEEKYYKTYLDTAVNKIKKTSPSGEVAADGVITGGLLGGIVGLFLGATAVAVPGGFFVAGPLAGALFGATGGATLGAFTGLLVEAGVPEEQVQILTDRLEKGEVAVVVEAEGALADTARAVMKKHNVKMIEEYK